MRINLDVKGLRQIQKALKRQPARADTGLAAAMTTEAERIMAQAKRLTPVDTGTLRSTGHVKKPNIQPGRSIDVVLGFGGPSASYAVYVHENLEANFTVGQAKFLEQPLFLAQDGLAGRLAAELRRFL